MRPGAFAAAVAGRHGATRGRLSRSPLVLLGLARVAGRGDITVSRHVHHHRTVRIALGVRHTTFVTRRREVVRHERVLTEIRRERLVAAAAPHDTPLRPVIRQSRTASRTPTIAAVPRVVRSVAAANVAPPAVREAPVLVKTDRERAAPRSAPPPLAVTSLELDRVTDHVLKSLDRRMSSWRDRRGRS